MRDRLQQIGAGAVLTCERDERAPQIVTTAWAEAQRLQVVEERLLGLRALPLGVIDVNYICRQE